MMAGGEGRIANVASQVAVRAGGSGTPQSASKHAVVGLTASKVFFYAGDGIWCNAVAPGSVITNIGETAQPLSAWARELLESPMAAITSRRPRRNSRHRCAGSSAATRSTSPHGLVLRRRMFDRLTSSAPMPSKDTTTNTPTGARRSISLTRSPRRDLSCLRTSVTERHQDIGDETGGVGVTLLGPN